MRISEEVVVNAEPRTVYRVAAEVADWPATMPHFRWIRVLGESGNRVGLLMAARLGLLPMRWRAEQSLFPDQNRIVFRHLGGVTSGMTVELRFAPTPSGSVAVVASSLDLGWPLVGWLGEAVVVVGISRRLAQLTLRRLKQLAEAEQEDLERLAGESLVPDVPEALEGE